MPRRNPENTIDETTTYAVEQLDEAGDQAVEAARLAQEAAAQPEPAPVEDPVQEPEEEPIQEAEAAQDMEDGRDIELYADDEMEDLEQSQLEPEPEIPPLSLRVQIHSGHPTDDIAATADVEINGICTIRNVKVKNDDYGLEVVMPRTKMPDTGRFRDACVFPRREMRSQFDMAVLSAYQQEMGMSQAQPQQEGRMGIHM